MPRVKVHLKDLFRTSLDEKTRKGYLRLDMNEGIPGLPVDFVKEVVSEIEPDFISAYPEYYSLQRKIASHNNLQPENILLSNGSDAAIKYIFDAYVSAGDKVLLTDPTFAMYPVYCKMFNAEPVMTEYKQDLSFPEEEFLTRINTDIKVAVVVNPNNPTGSVLEKPKLLKIIKKAVEKDVLIVIDEAYFYFYPETVIEHVKNYNNLIVLRTFSKVFGLASVRIGYVSACPQIIDGLRRVKPTYDVNGIAVLFSERILDNPNIIDNLIKNARDGKKYLAERLLNEGIEFKEGSANFILIKCYNRVEEMISKLADKKILVSGCFKQGSLKDYIRVTIGDRQTMIIFFNAFINLWRKQNA